MTCDAISSRIQFLAINQLSDALAFTYLVFVYIYIHGIHFLLSIHGIHITYMGCACSLPLYIYTTSTQS